MRQFNSDDLIDDEIEEKALEMYLSDLVEEATAAFKADAVLSVERQKFLLEQAKDNASTQLCDEMNQNGPECLDGETWEAG